LPIQHTNILLFMPSPRDIPQVKRYWNDLPADKLIVKYTPQLEAYQIGREYFLSHPEYTHLAICPDDLEVTKEGFEILKKDIEMFHFPVVSGICGIDENRPDIYAIQQQVLMDEIKPASDGWIENLPEETLFVVGHSGFCFEIIERDLISKVSWVGSSNNGRGNFDWQFSKDCKKEGHIIMVDQRVKMKHWRVKQYLRVRENLAEKCGYHYLLPYLNTNEIDKHDVGNRLSSSGDSSRKEESDSRSSYKCCKESSYTGCII